MSTPYPGGHSAEEKQMARAESKAVSHVKSYRQARGWSQDQLANRIGVRRQAIYDIEAGRYLPNTGVALRLARQFGCRVEDLFAEAGNDSGEPITLVADSGAGETRLAVARVRNRLVGYPLAGRRALTDGFRAADAVVPGGGGVPRLFGPAPHLGNTLLLLGCDPAFDILAAHVARLAPEARVLCGFSSSRRALEALAAGNAHLAGTHMHQRGCRDVNAKLATEVMEGRLFRMIGFSLIEEGLLVGRGNPRGIGDVADLAREGVRLVNRERGAALRSLLDDRLAEAGVPSPMVQGYGDEVGSHIEGAHRVACGAADAALGLRAIAETFDLGFVPLTAARCDLVIPADLFDHPVMGVLLEALNSRRFSRDLASLPGYDASPTGKAIATDPDGETVDNRGEAL